jgi:purine-nucleoside phosphorylase
MLVKIEETALYLQERTTRRPKIGIVLGTGLGNLATQITDKEEISYSEIPHFPVSTVDGHSGKLIIGRLGNKEVMAMQGRFHFYEGYDMQKVTFPVRVMHAFGIKTLFVSNASGGVNETFEIGDLMVIHDHINLFPEHPLRGKNYAELGPRFPDMSAAYDKELIRMAFEIASKHHIKLQKGVYVGTQGPTFETPAEYHRFRLMGGDAVGMSTVPEIIVARHMNMRCFAISIISDLGVPGKITKVTHEEVLQIANNVQPHMTLIIKEIINQL